MAKDAEEEEEDNLNAAASHLMQRYYCAQLFSRGAGCKLTDIPALHCSDSNMSSARHSDREGACGC